MTGASRGAGRGIALVLAEAGATVYITGRSAELHETSILAKNRGGETIAVQCDHSVDSDVQSLFDRMQAHDGRLDILVNNAWGGYESIENPSFRGKFWEQPLWRWDRMFETGVRGHYTSSRLAAPLMIRQGSGLIINTTFWDDDKYLTNVPYDLAKAATNRMVLGMGRELREFGVACIALSPGNIGGKQESIEYVGRAVLALATDSNVLRRTGEILVVAELAREYGFTDIDGSQPERCRIPG